MVEHCGPVETRAPRKGVPPGKIILLGLAENKLKFDRKELDSL